MTPAQRARVCLVTTGQPSTNPRLTKEADALAEAGFHVHVIGAHWADWASRTDEVMLRKRRWSCEIIDWRREHSPSLFHATRIRHWASRRLLASPAARLIRPGPALSRIGPELRARALTVPAELYIAHNLGALPAAAAAAHAYGAKLGFDAEDFHSGQFTSGDRDPMVRITVAAERELLPRCTYVTAAAPGIAEAYRDLCAIPLPTTILNVFPKADRPALRTATSATGPVRLYWFSQTIGPNRGLETAVAALPLLQGRPVEIHLRGQWQPGYEATLRSLAESCGVSQDAIVSHDPASPDEMVRCAAEFDVGLALEPPVSVNNDILLSNKVFTYLLAGTALVLSRTAGQSRLMPELGVAARAFDHDNPQSFAGALQTWVNSPEALAKARGQAWQLGEDRFNWDLEKQSFLRVVARTLDRDASTVGVGRTRPSAADRLAASHR